MEIGDVTTCCFLWMEKNCQHLGMLAECYVDSDPSHTMAIGDVMSMLRRC
jgi:hypothetical protein